MSWLFSRALVEAYSEATCSDGAPSAPSSSTPTPQAYLSPDRMTAFSRLSRFGTTFAPLTEPLGEDVLTWCRADSLARGYQQPGRDLALLMSDRASGPRWRELSARYDLSSCSWKTHRTLFPEGLPWSSVILPRWGMMRGGVCWEQTMPELRTGGNGSGLWQSPTAMDASPITGGDLYRTASGTVRARYGDSSSNRGLAAQVMWPTPTVACASGGQTSRSGDRKGELLLSGLVKMFPTPKSRDSKGQSQRGIHAPGDALPNMDSGDGTVVGGSLNPTWVEWLMMWPLGWTRTEPMPSVAWAAWLSAFLPESSD